MIGEQKIDFKAALFALKPVEPPKPFIQMSLEEVSAYAEWRSLTPRLKRIVGAYIRNGAKESNYDMLAAVKEVDWDLSSAAQVHMAEELLANAAIRAVLKLYFGTAILQLETNLREQQNELE